jgi:hypothetical protein
MKDTRNWRYREKPRVRPVTPKSSGAALIAHIRTFSRVGRMTAGVDIVSSTSVRLLASIKTRLRALFGTSKLVSVGETAFRWRSIHKMRNVHNEHYKIIS